MEQFLHEKSRAVGAALCIGAVLVASFLLLYKLGTEPLQDYDEATYAEVTTESLAVHQYLSFTFLDQPYFNKPPLLFWLMDVSDRAVHQTETAMRLPSALSGIALVAVVMLLTYAATGNAYAAAFSGGILLATSAFIEPARQVRFDILVSLFVILTLYAFLRAFEDRRWFLWLGVFVGLGILAKGPIEAFGIIASLGVAIAYKRIKWLLDPYLWGGVAISLLIAAPWHLYETLKFGEFFWDKYLGMQIIARVISPLFATGPTNAEYLQYLFTFAAPWATIFCICFVLLPAVWRKLVTQERALLLSSYIGVFAVLIVDLITQTKAVSYLIPLYPFMALVIAVSILGLTRYAIDGLRPFLVILSVCAIAFGLWLSIDNGFHLNGYYASDIALAQEEKTIGETLRERHAPQFYVYDTTTLGSIMFYSGLVKPEWISVAPPAGEYLLYQTPELQKLEMQYPQMHLASVYQGASLTLARVE